MDLFELTKALVDIPSVTGDEAVCARFLERHLEDLGFAVETQPVAGDRFNVFATRGQPKVVLSSHMDTVPPFIPASEDHGFVYGRGSCDAKGILAAQVKAGKQLLEDGITD